ncbi:MAG: hypothetical protein E7353_03270 [Clostridiales bacterium]|nr:hypothetical protein [Clostridiales bacterium]
MKRFKSLFLALILALALCVGLVACDDGGKKDETPDPVTYTLSFEMNGHGAQISDQVLEEDEVTVQPTNPTESGWNFEGWYTDNNFNELYTFGSTLSSDTTVYAKWEQEVVVNKHTVTFVTGVSDCVINAQDVAEGGKVTLPSSSDMVSKGKKFEGWFVDSNCTATFNANTPITQSISIYAKWSTYFKVTFDRNGRGSSSRVPQPQEYVVEGSKAIRPDDMSVNGYKFLGWSVDKNGKDSLWDFENTELTDSITLYAQWARIYTVSFDLNEESAFIAPPANQSVLEGELAVKPEDPVVHGFKFLGWYTESECINEFDFNTPVNSRLYLYAKWEDNTVGSIDSSDLPVYEWEKEAAYGDRPDLDGYVIDGYMGEDEHWEEQLWYEHGFTEAPTISYKMSTQFSEKGLYIFVQATDNGGISFTGRGYHYKNTGMQLMIIDGDVASPVAAFDSKTFRFDTYNARGSYHTYKLALQVVEGSVNPTGDDKRGVWNAEIFFTWENLGFDNPETVRIVPWYYYKRIQSATSNITFAPTFLTNTGVADAANFPGFNKDGYILADKEDAVLGHSYYGIAKTNGWDVSHIDDEENAYVQSTALKNTTQVMFFKQMTGNYYEVETDIEVPNPSTVSGRAGIMVYNSPILYMGMSVDTDTNSCTEDGFLYVRPRFTLTNKDGNPIHTYLDTIKFDQPVKKVNLKLIFSNGYIYYLLNGNLFYCQFINTINERTNPAIYTEIGSGVRFSNYKAQMYSANDIKEVTSKYAYVVSSNKLQRMEMSFSVIGVDRNNPTPITMNVVHDGTSVTNAIKDKIINNNDFSGVRLYELDTISRSINGGAYEDFTAEFISEDNGAKFGEFVIDNINGDTVFTNTARLVDTNNLIYVMATVYNSQTGKVVVGSPTVDIYSSNPRLSHYTMPVIGGKLFLILQKGYDYKLSISAEAFRTYRLDDITSASESINLGDIQFVPTIVGGTATSKNGQYSVLSNNTWWDYSEEENGVVYYISERAASDVAWFSGYSCDEYQVAEVKITNMTDPSLFPVYERDPACGFVINNFKTGKEVNKQYFIGLHQKGLRFLERGVAWNPTHYHTYEKSTVNYYDPTGEYYNKLTMVKVSRGGLMSMFLFIDDVFITSIDINGMGGETAIGFAVTTSYYCKIKFFDYKLTLGDEAIDMAKQLISTTVKLDDSCYEVDEEWNTDYSKPIISVEGVAELEKDDGSVEEMLFIGQEVTLKLNTEYALPNTCYTVKIGDATIVLSDTAPTAKYVLPSALNEDVQVSVLMDPSSTMTGRVIYENGKPVPNATGKIIADSGEIINFTAGSDGTFSATVIANKTYKVEIDINMYINVEKTTYVSSVAKDVGDIVAIPVKVGGKNSSITSGSNATVKYGYNYSDAKGNVIEGAYTEVNANGDNTQATQFGPMGDFILDFSYFRTEIPGIENEKDPAVGLNFYSSGVGEFYGFWRTGSLVLINGSWSNNRTALNKLPASVADYNVQFDFRVIRRGTTFTFFAKTESMTDYVYCMSYTADKDFGKAEFGLRVTAGKPMHHFFYNVNATPLSSANIPEYLIRDYSVTNGEDGTIRVSGSSVAEANKAAVGDKIVVRVAPNPGKIVAYALVNGKIQLIENNVLTYTIGYDGENNIEIVYEDVFETRNVKGKIVALEGMTLPEQAKVTAQMPDGRKYTFDVTPNENGEFEIDVREGNLYFYVETATMYSKSVEYTVSETNLNIGELKLDVYKVGNITVNGGNMNADLSYVYDSALGEYRAPGRSGGTAYMPELIASGDFLFNCDVTLNTGDPTSKYYSPDFSTGFEITNGKVNVDNQRTFGILFTCDGFRVSHGGWSNTYMVETHNGLDYYYPRNNPNDVTHNFKLARFGTTLKVYVNDELSMVITPTDGVKMYVDGNVVNKPHSGPGNLTDCENWIKNQVNTMFGTDGGDIAIGYKVNINTATNGILNSAGFRNTYITSDPTVLEQYK